VLPGAGAAGADEHQPGQSSIVVVGEGLSCAVGRGGVGARPLQKEGNLLGSEQYSGEDCDEQDEALLRC
jgi:hypothetical protein